MEVNVLAFGIAKDIFGAPAINIEQKGHTVNDLKFTLEETYPRLKQLASYMVAVNNEYTNGDMIITEHDEVAIIPPVSGG